MADPKSFPFPSFIEVRDTPGVLRRVGSVREAAECLLHGWPEQKGMGHRLALKACYLALKGEGTVDAAHGAFIMAAMEDGIFVRETPMNSSEGV
jgi:hypothetical protein